MSENGGLKRIEEKFLDVGDLFALEYSQGLVFLQVRGWETLKFSPYNRFTPIPPQDNSGFDRFEEDGDDILHIPEDEKKVLHAGIGHAPAQLRRYTNYPEGENRLRKFPNLSSPTARSGDDYGYIDGNDSPYDTPTSAEELFVPPGVHLDFDFYNPDLDSPHQPKVSLVMREYSVEVLDPEEHPNVAKRTVSPGSPIPIAPVGSIDSKVNYRMGSKWGVEPISYEEAQSIGGGN